MKGIAQCAEGDPINHYLMIKSVTRSVASNNKPFLTIMLQDVTGEIEAKLWDATSEDEQVFLAETIVKVEGEITTFRNKKQLKIRSIRPITDADPVKKSDLIPTAPLAVQDMMEHINQCIFEIQNPKLQRITRALVKKHQEAFFEYPAAVRNHHEYLSGLAFHVVSMLKLAQALAELYPELDLDLLYSGIILHDMGKVIELSGPTATSYTLEGKLLGHISIMSNEIAETARELEIDGEEVVVLQHLILSHHSKGEWGSPKPPLLREAEVLHMIDNFDAKLNMMNRALENTKPGDFTEKLFAMDQRAFYKPLFERKVSPISSDV
ncbi:3'-5' exoribonuclease YhaM [Pullulanibacillus camelliae]|uniref:3'-5' exoribonuclease YhaM n=2 Tax=Pullulanibacillus camelliae TaxID=1707096 RepID=A0A8J2YI61_9BACL|nr:3'-5' exoribonuclease YhaM [Pullulanibacillus camelliae]GGE44422.1 3'-5' exoribonuclease YhaM [Pullulanibacillus camelliae]